MFPVDNLWDQCCNLDSDQASITNYIKILLIQMVSAHIVRYKYVDCDMIFVILPLYTTAIDLKLNNQHMIEV